MSTTTDTGPDVQVSNADTGEIYPTQVNDRVDQLDGAASDGSHTVDVARLAARADRLAAENVELRKRLGGWTPQQRRDIDSVADLTEGEQRLAMVAPTLDDLLNPGPDDVPPNPVAAAIVGADQWPVWLDEVHHAHAAWSETVTTLRAWSEQYSAREIERTVAEPVAVDYSYRQTEAALWAQTVVSLSEQREQATVYSELAPERIAEPPEQADRSDVERMTQRSREQLRRRERDTSADVTLADYLAAKDAQDAHEAAKSRRPWWRRHADVIAGVAIGLATFASVGITALVAGWV